jgi:hypothetical protein
MLEIALFYTEVIENSQLTISKSWRVQFSEYFTKKNGTLDYEVDSLLHSKEIISWKDLELLKLFMA